MTTIQKLKDAKKQTGISIKTLTRLCIRRALSDIVEAITKVQK